MGNEAAAYKTVLGRVRHRKPDDMEDGMAEALVYTHFEEQQLLTMTLDTVNLCPFHSLPYRPNILSSLPYIAHIRGYQ